MPKKLTQQEFINKANQIHNNEYDYSLVEYKNNKTKVKIICHIHGIFEQLPSQHLCHNGCPKCAGKNKSIQEIINLCNKVHNNFYDYSKVNYTKSNSIVCIICPHHGEFYQNLRSHYRGSGCPKCSKKYQRTLEEWINDFNKVHYSIYDYSHITFIQGLNHNITIICKQHGKFQQTPKSHLKGYGCPKCNQSKGEKEIEHWLIKNKFKFIPEMKFNQCKGKVHKLPFDFYLPDLNICIEYDGKQHFEPVTFNGCSVKNAKENFQRTKINDKIKNKYCKENNIILIRISYKDNIIQKLNMGVIN